MTYIAYKQPKALLLLALSVGNLPQNHDLQNDLHYLQNDLQKKMQLFSQNVLTSVKQFFTLRHAYKKRGKNLINGDKNHV